jgi:phospholipid N-methyltransferase
MKKSESIQWYFHWCDFRDHMVEAFPEILVFVIKAFFVGAVWLATAGELFDIIISKLPSWCETIK